MELELRPKKILLILGSIICLLVIANTISMLAFFRFAPEPNTTLYYLIEYFNLASENNFPTYFSSTQLLLCTAFLTLIGTLRKKHQAKDFWQWYGLAFIFLFLSLDESLMIHEVVAVKIRHHIQLTGILFYAWIIPYSVFTLVVLVAYIPFLLKLSMPVKKRMILAGGVFVFGALGFEAIESWYFSETGSLGPLYMILAGIEESMEMAGILLFLHALFYYTETELGGISLSIASSKQSPTPSFTPANTWRSPATDSTSATCNQMIG